MSKWLVEVVRLLGDLDLERECPRCDISFETCDEDNEELLYLNSWVGHVVEMLVGGNLSD